MEKVINRGLIPLEKSTDWLAADLVYEVNVPDGNWTPFLTRFEKQRFRNVETMACVSFSGNQICEMQIKQKTGVEVNFSDRFLAKCSGTTKQGNALSIVGDTLRNIGVVHEEEWPVPPEPFNWDNYYSDIPSFVIKKAKAQFLDKYDVHYGSVSDHSPQNLLYHLKQAPLWVTIPGHAIAGCVVNVAGNKITYFDTYEPALKTVPISKLDAVKTLVLTIKEQQDNSFMFDIYDDNGTYFLVGDVGKWGIADWETLGEFKRLSNKPVKVGSTAHIPLVRNIERGFSVS